MVKLRTKGSRKAKEASRIKARQRRAITKDKNQSLTFDSSSGQSETSYDNLKASALQTKKSKKKEGLATTQHHEEEVKELPQQLNVIQKFEKLRNLMKNSNKKQISAVNDLQTTVDSLCSKVAEMSQQLQLIPKLESDISSIKSMLVSVLNQQSLPQASYSFPMKEANEVVLGIALKNWLEAAPHIKIDQELLKEQVIHMTEASELETLRRHSSTLYFWELFLELYYVQMALRICMMRVSKRSVRSVSNNTNSFKLIAKICKEKGFLYLDFNRVMQVEGLIQDWAQCELRKLSTLNLYLSHFSQLVRQVYGIKEYAARIESNERPPPNLIVSIEDIQMIIDWLRRQPDELDQLFGFCLYLMLVTAARNKTIRTLEFSAFVDEVIQRQHVYSFYVKETKTGKSKGFFISKDVFDYVQRIKAKRLVWASEQEARMKYLDEEQKAKLQKLIIRRKQYIFTFFTNSAIQYHLEHLRHRNLPKQVEFMQSFILHNIRKARIRQAYKQDPSKALELAGHSRLSVTEHYIGYTDVDPNIKWQSPIEADQPSQIQVQMMLDSIFHKGEDDGEEEEEDEDKNVITIVEANGEGFEAIEDSEEDNEDKQFQIIT